MPLIHRLNHNNMKARTENGQIKIYKSLPSEFTKEDGSVILNFRNANEETLKSAGFYDVVVPSYNPKTKVLGDIEWDADNSQFTYPVSNKTWSETLSELKENKIEQLKAIYNSKLSATDWYIVRNSEKGTAIPSDIQTERDNLRSECATKEGEINAKTTKAQVADYDLPNAI